MDVLGFAPSSGVVEQQDMESIKVGEYTVHTSEEFPNQADIVAEPLERGFGCTLGNALRRVMLSSLRGGAVVAVEIDGVLHEFSTVPGVREDVTEIVMNLKKLSIYTGSESNAKLTLKAEGAGDVYAEAFEVKGDIKVMNPRQFICSLDKGGSINMTLYVGVGRGYQSAEQILGNDARPIGRIYLDANFSPVNYVTYRVENTRVGQNTQYDKLIMNVRTNGSITPVDAISEASMILREQFAIFVDESLESAQSDKKKSLFSDINPHLLRKVNELELSVRSANCLKNDNIVYIGDLVQKTEQDMLHTPNFGRKSLNEIREILGQLDLELGMKVPNWPPDDIEELAKSLDEPY